LNEVENVLRDISTGKLKAVRPPIESEEEYLKEYTSRLFHKLEDKIVELEQENRMRKHSEEEQHKAAQQWYTTFNAIKDAVCLMDMERNILRCNRSMTELIGKPYNEIIGFSCYEVIQADCKTWMNALRAYAENPLQGNSYSACWK